VRDITDQKKAHEALHLAATTFETHEGIMITDHNAKILRVNHNGTYLMKMIEFKRCPVLFDSRASTAWML
jgi:hypothetical protein